MPNTRPSVSNARGIGASVMIASIRSGGACQMASSVHDPIVQHAAVQHRPLTRGQPSPQHRQIPGDHRGDQPAGNPGQRQGHIAPDRLPAHQIRSGPRIC